MDDICRECVHTHSQQGLSYEWLLELGYGPVVKVWFKEPEVGKGWILYDDEWWSTHCKAVSHGDNLYEAHMRAFVDPKTRFAELLFLFNDGTLMNPTSEFYELEQTYFDINRLCR